jgi:uncharacterized protein (TIGR02594 family)
MFTVKVTAHQLHLRKGAGTKFDSITLLNQNEVLQVQDVDATGTWLAVQTSDANHKKGWCSGKYLLPETVRKAPWLAIAVKEIGIREYPDTHIPPEHPRIVEYLATVEDLSKIHKNSDETAWCSCFMNWCVEQAKLDGTNSAWAKSWGNWRTDETLASAKLGDIAVFERTSPTVNGGHVGIFIKADGDHVWVLGGNQSNSVRYSRYPINGMGANNTRYKLLSCRSM